MKVTCAVHWAYNEYSETKIVATERTAQQLGAAKSTTGNFNNNRNVILSLVKMKKKITLNRQNIFISTFTNFSRPANQWALLLPRCP
jgi:hypothetical protein